MEVVEVVEVVKVVEVMEVEGESVNLTLLVTC